MAKQRSATPSVRRKAGEVLNPILQGLREKGERVTKVRKATLEILQSEGQPISAQLLGERLKELGLEVNKTTVYRELQFLQRQGLLSELDLMDGHKRYELSTSSEHHHHHLVCTECRQVTCIDVCSDLEAAEKRVAKDYGFKIKSHVYELFGVCKTCQG